MRKEVLFAVAAGILFGIILAFGIWRANSALKPESQPQSTESQPQATKTQNSEEFAIALILPDQYDVITQSPVLVSGVTSAGSWVLLSGEEEDYIIRVDETGKFEQEVELTPAVNQIIISSFNSEGNSVSQNLTIVYSTEFQE